MKPRCTKYCSIISITGRNIEVSLQLTIIITTKIIIIIIKIISNQIVAEGIRISARFSKILCLKLYQLVINRQSSLLNTCFDREDLLSAYFVTLDTALNLTLTDATNQIQDTITLTNQLWISDLFSSFYNIFNIFMNCDESSIDRFRQAK